VQPWDMLEDMLDMTIVAANAHLLQSRLLRSSRPAGRAARPGQTVQADHDLPPAFRRPAGFLDLGSGEIYCSRNWRMLEVSWRGSQACQVFRQILRERLTWLPA